MATRPPPLKEVQSSIDGNLKVAVVLSLTFAVYLFSAALKHLADTDAVLADGVEVAGVTTLCVKERHKAKTLSVGFATEDGREWTCHGVLKAKCEVENAVRYVTYRRDDPSRCMIGRRAQLMKHQTGVRFPLVAGVFFLLLFAACLVALVRRWRSARSALDAADPQVL
jgi:hypothetical protein